MQHELSQHAVQYIQKLKSESENELLKERLSKTEDVVKQLEAQTKANYEKLLELGEEVVKLRIQRDEYRMGCQKALTYLTSPGVTAYQFGFVTDLLSELLSAEHFS